MPETPKPRCRLTGTDRTMVSLLARVTTALKQAGQHPQATMVALRVQSCASYEEALQLFREYVEVT
jgi:hypothetical protein